MMQRFTEYDRPFFGRAANMLLGPFNPAETAAVTGLSGADAIDAHLITGGLPGVCLEWPPGGSPGRFPEYGDRQQDLGVVHGSRTVPGIGVPSPYLP
jgi:hypothetical protein